MLRASLLRSRPFAVAVNGPRCGAQWLPVQRGSSAVLGQRFLADVRKPDDSVVPVMPGSQSKDVAIDIPPPPTITTPANPSEAPLPPQSVPKEPPSPQEVNAAIPAPPPPPPDTSTPPSSVPTGTGTASVAPPSGPTPLPPPAPKRRPRRFRRFLTTLLLLSTLGYGGGVYYSLINDNFHDFFTEYVPYAEDAVGYFEEREFRRRFPGNTTNPRLHTQVRGENKVTIPSKSGISWKVAEDDSSKGTDLGSKGRHVSALEDNKPEKDMAVTRPEKTTASEKTKTVEDIKKEAKEEKSLSHELMPKDAFKPEPEAPKSEAAKSQPAPKSEPAAPAPTEAPAKPAPIPLIDNIGIKSATEPVVQDVAKILNDIITVVNADNASDKYSSTIAKAKDDLAKVINDIDTLRATEQKAAEDKINNLHAEFDNAAKELIRRLENEMREQEAHWKDEYESEREKLSQTYQNKVKSELEAAQKVYDQRLKNELLEEQIALKRDFTSAVRDRVETERNGRLSKLNELASSVEELERLTAEWNSVVDANLKTQHLLVAVEAVRSTLEQADRPRPFVAELAALKEVAADDPVVSAAIASIPPTAYQRGIPTPAQLIDRFRRVAAEVRKAALLPENAGVASHAASLVLSKLMFKKQGAHGLPVGSDVESVLARTEMLLEEGNLDQAAREMNQLSGWAKMLCRDWLAECRKVLEVQQALDVITTEARLQSLLVD